jgi:Na+/melibiose symporter-like transporter
VFVQYTLSVGLLPVAVRVGNSVGRHRALVFGGFGFLALLPLFMLVPAGNFVAALAVFVLLGLISNFIWIMPPAIVADTVEYGMMKGAGDDSAIYMALYLFTQKIALAAGVGIALPLAAALGFDPTAAVSDQALRALSFVALILPCCIGIFGALILYNYPIDARRHAIIRRWLARRNVKENE